MVLPAVAAPRWADAHGGHLPDWTGDGDQWLVEMGLDGFQVQGPGMCSSLAPAFAWP